MADSDSYTDTSITEDLTIDESDQECDSPPQKEKKVLLIVSSNPKKRQRTVDCRPANKKSSNSGLTSAAIRSTRMSLLNENWFLQQSFDEQTKTIQRVATLRTHINVVSMEDIINLNIPYVQIKELYTMRRTLDSMHKMDPEYDAMAQRVNEKYTFYSDPGNYKKICALAEIMKKPANDTITMQIVDSNFDDYTKKQIYQRLISGGCDEKHKAVQWVRRVLDLPTRRIETTNIGVSVDKLFERMNDQMCGMQKAKEEILAKLISIFDGPSKHKALGLCAPPGVGKTMLVRIIAETLGLPFRQISLGGITDSAFLEGHSYTYSGAQSGVIVDSIISMGCTNGILFFDEIDKISETRNGKEVAHALLHIVDFTQNHDFRDKYMPEIPIDLSDMFFIYSMNSTDDMDRTLLSRVPVIHLDGYNEDQRCDILTRQLLPDALAKFGLTLTIDSAAKLYLVRRSHSLHNLPRKCGVRELLHDIQSIVEKIKVHSMLNTTKSFLSYSLKSPVHTITYDVIDILLPAPKGDSLSYYS